MRSEEKVLFSEHQVDALVEEKMKAWMAERKLADNPPNTIDVVRSKVIMKLGEYEEQIVNKHKETLSAWESAYKKYGEFLSRNPGAQNISSPGIKPELPHQVEIVRAWKRAFECIDDETVKIQRGQWVSVFQDAGQAMTELSTKHNQYAVYCSGAMSSFSHTTSTNLGGPITQ